MPSLHPKVCRFHHLQPEKLHPAGSMARKTPARAAVEQLQNSHEEIVRAADRAEQLGELIEGMQEDVKRPCNLNTHHESRWGLRNHSTDLVAERKLARCKLRSCWNLHRSATGALTASTHCVFCCIHSGYQSKICRYSSHLGLSTKTIEHAAGHGIACV